MNDLQRGKAYKQILDRLPDDLTKRSVSERRTIALAFLRDMIEQADMIDLRFAQFDNLFGRTVRESLIQEGYGVAITVQPAIRFDSAEAEAKYRHKFTLRKPNTFRVVLGMLTTKPASDEQRTTAGATGPWHRGEEEPPTGATLVASGLPKSIAETLKISGSRPSDTVPNYLIANATSLWGRRISARRFEIYELPEQ